MLMGAMTGLVLAVAGCERPEVPVDTNPNPMFGAINLTNAPTGYTPGLIVDEDRDGTPDYITFEHTRGGNRILYVRPDFTPKSTNYVTDSNTKVMDHVTMEAARQAMRYQTDLKNSLKAYNTKK
jgi:hypothetical protein